MVTPSVTSTHLVCRSDHFSPFFHSNLPQQGHLTTIEALRSSFNPLCQSTPTQPNSPESIQRQQATSTCTRFASTSNDPIPSLRVGRAGSSKSCSKTLKRTIADPSLPLCSAVCQFAVSCNKLRKVRLVHQKKKDARFSGFQKTKRINAQHVTYWYDHFVPHACV